MAKRRQTFERAARKRKAARRAQAAVRKVESRTDEAEPKRAGGRGKAK